MATYEKNQAIWVRFGKGAESKEYRAIYQRQSGGRLVIRLEQAVPPLRGNAARREGDTVTVDSKLVRLRLV